MKYSLILLVALMALSLAIHYFADPDSRLSANPSHDLHEMTLHDADLGQALVDADQGSIGALSAWINRSDFVVREHLASLLCGMLRDPKRKNELDPALCWKYRNRFRAFIGLSTGNEKLDTTIDNLLAYTLVTGTTNPNAADINLARSLEPRLKHDAKDSTDASIEDTIGCIEFAAHDFTAAKEAFAQGLSYLAQVHDSLTPGFEQLERKRLAASAHNAQASTPRPGEDATAATPAPGTPTPELMPLPLEEEAPEEVKKP